MRADPKPLPRPPRAPRPIRVRQWRSTKRAGTGICVYCGRWGKLTWDHVVPRSLMPEAERDNPANLVRACLECNIERTRGLKPPWKKLPKLTREFVLKHRGPVFASRYFTGVSA